ncbi:MAG: glycoside hydrolase family 3 N-terminal domain-containing protein [Longimicrobiales bacterium]
MKAGPARLLFPAIRWDSTQGFDAQRSAIENALRRGVGGFIIFGGEADAVRQVTAATQERCDYPLLFGSDLERGAGQQFNAATQLPPLAAIGAMNDVAITKRAGRLTAEEARSVGVTWIFAPDADVDLEPANPIVGTRSFGSDSARVAAHVAAWTRGCHEGGAMSCAKHFPGHGRTTDDSHAKLPRVTASLAQLERDLEPFRAAIAAGIDGIMTAHVVFEALDPTTAATLSPRIVTDLLRHELRFEGIVATDGMGMQGILDACDGSEARAGIAAINAGCNVLLYPTDVNAIADAIVAELGRSLTERRVTESLERIAAGVHRAPTRAAGTWGDVSSGAWAGEIALRSVHSLRDRHRLPRAFDVITVDDDLGGPFTPPARDVFIQSLRDVGMDPDEVEAANADRAVVIALYADTRAWKGTPDISATARARVDAAVRMRSDAVIVLFGHPRLAESLPGNHLVAAWGGEAVMQRAAANWLGQDGERR